MRNREKEKIMRHRGRESETKKTRERKGQRVGERDRENKGKEMSFASASEDLYKICSHLVKGCFAVVMFLML